MRPMTISPGPTHHADVTMTSSLKLFQNHSPIRVYGKVHRIVGLVVEGTCPRSAIGSLCEIIPAQGGTPVPAEIVGYNNDKALLMPLGELRGLGPGSLISVKKEQATIRVGEALLGRVIDGMERPLDRSAASSSRRKGSLFPSAGADGTRKHFPTPRSRHPRHQRSYLPAAWASAWGSWPAPASAKASSSA